MRRLLLSLLLFCMVPTVWSQQPPSMTSADIFLRLKKLEVLGSVLYVAAHPDDENTRLLAWLAKERLYRTAYLSLTRGDGGQNLIGDEQGVDLGLIRTQELLAARRIDGAEQFFTRAFDFGFTKTTEEALQTWDKEKVLADVVWVIRKFQPDIIIARFPEDSRAGHGHHSGSAVLAHEAFRAAADPNRFPEQLKRGVTVWQAKRIMWNTFNFGNTNTTSEDQLKIDVGAYNALLGKSYGEIAAESRSQHKSQGFGVPGSRGQQFEYFTPVEGEKARTDIMDDINVQWSRIPGGAAIGKSIEEIIAQYNLLHPERSVPALIKLYKALAAFPDSYWKKQKLAEVLQLIEYCGGLWLEASANSEYAVLGDSMMINVNVNNRLGLNGKLLGVSLEGSDTTMHQTLQENRNYSFMQKIGIPSSKSISQPYWLEKKMSAGSFNVEDLNQIGKPQNDGSLIARFSLEIEGLRFDFDRAVMYKYTDPVRGELFQPLVVVPPAAVSTDPSIVIFRKQQIEKQPVQVSVMAHRQLNGYTASVLARTGTESFTKKDSAFNLARGLSREYTFSVSNAMMKDKTQDFVQGFIELKQKDQDQAVYLNQTSIKYDHIPHIHYFYQDAVKVLNMDLKTVGKKIGYIEGAGDKVPVALTQMGYEVTVLKEKDLIPANLKQFDAILTGVRAYNVNDFMAARYEALMNYVFEGGNLIVQYNTNNFISSVKSRMGPLPFTVSRNRVTDENAKVDFLLPEHPVLNFPNKINQSDFDGWIQERGIYFAEPFDPGYEAPLSMADPNEPAQKGSLIIAKHGRGTFVYTGLVFFRELPAGVPGAYRLLANIIALNYKKGF